MISSTDKNVEKRAHSFLLVEMKISIIFMKRHLAIRTRNILKFCIFFDPKIYSQKFTLQKSSYA